MGVVTIKDYITLAKAGYKKAEIDKIITLAESEEETNPEGQQSAPAPTDDKAEGAEPEKASEKEEKPETEEEEIDYKALYEQSQKDLKAAQAFNRTQDSSGKDPEYTYKDLQNAISQLF